MLGAASKLLQHCRLTEVGVRGDCSINACKGLCILMCELRIRMKWQGEVRAASGSVVQSASGTLHLPDVSPESLDDLAVEFEMNARRTPLSEAMRKMPCARCHHSDSAASALCEAVPAHARGQDHREAGADSTPDRGAVVARAAGHDLHFGHTHVKEHFKPLL